jgi:ribosomal protein S18 acetylase RimI-like enzyme
MAPNHFDQVVDLRRSAFDNELDVALGRSYAMAFVDVVRTSPASICLVAENQGRVVGYALAVAEDAMPQIRNSLTPLVLRLLLVRPWALFNGTVRNRLRRRIGEELGVVAAAGTNPTLRPPTVWLLSIAVNAEARRRGVGRALIQALEEAARLRSFQSVKLFTAGANEPALRFYQQLRWTQIDSGSQHYACFCRDLGER